NPVPAALHPQGPDYCKALLEFAKGEPIETQEQADWLAIACANAYGFDKAALQDRVNWTNTHQDMIISIANDPYTCWRRWTTDDNGKDVSEPFQFLRACIEWRDFKREGFGFISHMIVAADATCSGLQHYSAMLRDEVGGRSVNLVPGLVRQDIYQDVANRVV